ncbi:MAG: hypothetical protein RR140_00450 [Clostridia bacterium]
MKKIFSRLLIVVMLSVSMLFAGCNLVEINMEKYMNEPVATLKYENGQTEKISRKDYFMAWNSYGQNLMTEQKMEKTKAQEETVKALINRRVMLVDAKSKVNLTNADNRELWNTTLIALKDNLADFEKEVRAKHNTQPYESEEDKKDEVLKREKFKPVATVSVLNGEYVIKITNSQSSEDNSQFTKTCSDIQILLFEETVQSQNLIKAEAMVKYIKILKANEQKLNLSTINAEIFLREVERIYNNSKENMYITKLQNLNKYGNQEGPNGERISTITVKDVLQKYSSLLATSKTKSLANTQIYIDSMTKSYDTTTYALDDEYFFVAHILAKYSDETKAQIAEISQKQKNGELTFLQAQNQKNNIINNAEVIIRDENGVVTKNTITIAQLMKSLQADLDNSTNKNETFVKNMFCHSQDDATLTSMYPYVIGTKNSQMVESFNESARKLHKDGVLGALSQPTESDYGVHILFYMGGVKNLFTLPYGKDLNLAESDITKLVNTPLSAFTNKTVFDFVYEQLAKDNYSSFETAEILILKEKLVITKYAVE